MLLSNRKNDEHQNNNDEEGGKVLSVGMRRTESEIQDLSDRVVNRNPGLGFGA